MKLPPKPTSKGGGETRIQFECFVACRADSVLPAGAPNLRRDSFLTKMETDYQHRSWEL